MFKKTLATLVAASLIYGGMISAPAALAAPGKDLQIIPVIVNGQKVKFPDTEPYINTDGSTMVPLRFVSEKLGAEVKWENAMQTAIISYEGKTIRMAIGSKIVSIDGATQELDTSAEMYDTRTMVPLRFVSEVLNSKVEWDKASHSVRVTDAAYQAKVDAGEVKLDPWGREYSKVQDDNWLRLTDLESTGFYNVGYKSTNKDFYTSKLATANGKDYVDSWADHIRKYYEAQLNVDYRTIDPITFSNTLLANMKGMSSAQAAENRTIMYDYVKWVKQNKVIAKGYADPENSQVESYSGSTAYMRVYFKFMIISAQDSSQTFLDNWNVSNLSDSFQLKKGIWYGGYAGVLLNTNVVNAKFSSFAVDQTENMFVKDGYKYEMIK